MKYWENEKVSLRAFEESDAQFFFDTIGNYEMQYGNCDFRFPMSMRKAKEIVSGFLLSDNEKIENQFMIIENKEGNAVGIIDTHNCDVKTGCFEYGISVLPNYRRCGYAQSAIKLILRYFFEERRFQKANVSIYSFNYESIKLHEKMGFVKEGTIRRNFFTGGKYYDTELYGLTDDEYYSLYKSK